MDIESSFAAATAICFLRSATVWLLLHVTPIIDPPTFTCNSSLSRGGATWELGLELSLELGSELSLELGLELGLELSLELGLGLELSLELGLELRRS